jgi:hypothetical protein
VDDGEASDARLVVPNFALESPKDLDRPDVRALIEAALQLARISIEQAKRPELVVQSVSAKQRTHS